MKKTLLFFMGVLSSALLFSQSQLQVFQDWSTTAGTQNFYHRNVTQTDGSGNVYVAGATVNSGNGTTDMLVAKYNAAGVQQWINQYNGAADDYDFATALQVDASGNVYITGTVVNDTVNHYSDVITIKYNSSGVQQWSATYNGAAGYFDSGTSLLVQSGGAVVVIGSSMNTGGTMDYVTLAYNSSGVQQWATVYDYSAHLNDVPVSIAARGASIYVSGVVQASATDYNWNVVQYNASGVQQAVTTSTGGSSSIDTLNDMVIDATGNIYIAGATWTPTEGFDFDIIKLDAGLSFDWEQTYDGADHLDDVAKGIKVDSAGNVYVTGISATATQGKNYVTQQYSSGGALNWTSSYNDAFNGDDEANALELSKTGEIYVTGSAYTDSLNTVNYHTIKYNTSGTELWSVDYDGRKHLKDMATNIAIDTVGNVIVTGSSETAGGVYEYGTVRYVEKEVIVPADYYGETPQKAYSFYENKGQLLNTSKADISSTVKYYTNKTAPMHFIGDKSSSYVFAHIDSIKTSTDTMQRIDVSFNGNVNTGAKTYPLEKKSNYLSYFLGHIPDGITEIHANADLITSNLYNNIDLEYSSNQNGIKYYFIIKPGGNLSDIQLEFTGASSFNLDGTTNALTINSLIGNIIFNRPTVYQVNSSNVVVPITGWTADWQTNGASNKYKFNTGTYDNTKALIVEIDQGNSTTTASSSGNAEWSTFYGGMLLDEFKAVQTDDEGNSYTTGESESIDFPATPGVLQDTLTFDSDVIVVKFDATTLDNTWATYFGGTGHDLGFGLRIGPGIAKGGSVGDHEVYVTGSTTSADFPVLSSAQSFGYGTDGFVFRLNSNGAVKVFSTYFGGGGDEVFNDIVLDKSNNLYALGKLANSNSGWTIPLHAQTGTTSWSTGGGIIVKMSTTGVLKWATQIGNYYDTGINSGTVDAADNLFITGSTKTGYPTPNGAFPTFLGNEDAFITKFNASDNNIAWSTYFGGDDVDVGTKIAIKSTGEVAIAGYTLTPTAGHFKVLNYPSGGNTFHGGSAYGDCFIAAFSNSGTQLFGTYFGGNNDDQALGLCFDAADRLFVTGSSNSTNTWVIPGTNTTGTYNVTTNAGGIEDAFVASFDINYDQKWGTYFGGSGWDKGYGVACAAADKLYLAGATKSYGGSVSGHFPLFDFGGTSYYQNLVNGNNINTGGYWDGYMARFDLADIPFVGINEPFADGTTINVYPDPSGGEFNVSIDLTTSKKTIIITVCDIIGKEINTETIKNPQQSIKKVIDLSYLSSGIYLLKIKINESIYNKKLIKN